MTTIDLQAAHRHSSNHRAALLASNACGCFYCCETYHPTMVKDWVEDKEGTALCPRCGVDSVLGDTSGLPVVEPGFLRTMRAHWFGAV